MKKPLNIKLPALPGVYFFKNSSNAIIYIGKAKSLKKRVNSYFQKNHTDWKVALLLDEYESLDFITTKSELEALLLETELIRKHKPKFNVLLKDGQPFVYILFTKENVPKIAIVRNKTKKGKYFGPFIHKNQARYVHNFLIKTFNLNLCNKKIENGCLDFHIGTCPGSCKKNFNIDNYLFNLQLAQDVLTSSSKIFLEKIKAKINEHNSKFEFERAKQLNKYINNFEFIFSTIKTHFSTNKYFPEIFAATNKKPKIENYETIEKELQKLLQTKRPINTIDCFDISHFQSQFLVGSCVRFTNGEPDKNKFRRFKIKTLTQQNDYAALQEIVERRYKNGDLPDLILIDGGKGQLSAVKRIIPNSHCVSLAKQEETLFCDAYRIKLNIQNDAEKMLIELRDYAHHFAISYHKLRRSKEKTY